MQNEYAYSYTVPVIEPLVQIEIIEPLGQIESTEITEPTDPTETTKVYYSSVTSQGVAAWGLTFVMDGATIDLSGCPPRVTFEGREGKYLPSKATLKRAAMTALMEQFGTDYFFQTSPMVKAHPMQVRSAALASRAVFMGLEHVDNFADLAWLQINTS